MDLIKRKIKKKLQSEEGASITFALLIFLVCAIISSVIIVAASTTGGRMSGMRETDQRYYAATAAAHVLQEIFDGKTVEVTYSVSDPSSAPTTSETNSILAAASTAVITRSTKTSIDTKEVSIDDYSCKVTVTLNSTKLANGLASFDIEATGGTANINWGTYKLTIVFSSNIKKPEAGSGSSQARASVTWSLNSISTAQAQSTTSTQGG